MSEDSSNLPGAASLQWRGPWAVQLWLEQPGSDASIEVLKTSVAPGETLERAVEVAPGSRARIVVVSGPEQEFRCRIEGIERAEAERGGSAGATRRWSGSTRFEEALPVAPGRVTMTIDTPRSGRLRLELEVVDAATDRDPHVE